MAAHEVTVGPNRCGCCGGSGVARDGELSCCPGVFYPRTIYATVSFPSCPACDRTVPLTIGPLGYTGVYAGFYPGTGVYEVRIEVRCFGSPGLEVPTIFVPETNVTLSGPGDRIGNHDECARSIAGDMPGETPVVGPTTGTCDAPLNLTATGTTWAKGTCPSTTYTVTITE